MKEQTRRSVAVLAVAGVLGFGIPFAVSTQTPARLTLELADYAEVPITVSPGGVNTMAQLARVNYLRDEPGGRRFLVVDLNGPLYFLDKQSKQFTTYLNFNGSPKQPGLFPRFTYQQNFATGLTNVILDPDYARNGVFYSIHFEDPAVGGPAAPKTGIVPGLDLANFSMTPAMPPRPGYTGPVQREVVMIEWTDRNTANATFEGTARELLRVQHPRAIHPLGEMTFNPAARPGHPDWRVMYVGIGDSATGDARDDMRLSAQRLDSIHAKVLRIIPDLREHVSTSTVSENGRYRIPNDNPFTSIPGARKEVWALGIRNPHRLSWDLDPALPLGARLFAFNIGSTMAESVVIVQKGANYGYPDREGIQARSLDGAGPIPADDTMPLRISATESRPNVRPVYPVISYPIGNPAFGDAIAGGFVYRGKRLPALHGKLIYGDITTGRIWYSELAEVLKADDGNPATLAAMHEISSPLRARAEAKFKARGGEGETLPGAGAASGRGRVDLRFAMDAAGELYVLTKSDGMIREVVAAK